ncbi:M28 family metallopeptidase [Rhizosphaericola mali]|uniref:M28 family peptidase n=1 Tax=Rhizosphaericola mali TaxID=2545455 RepID=A0A5P2G246_9BACT|nr:M28 family metallopeptidase [Rhizosphaericola mali]QES89535.1 M28 family peptidase [Rhizosphaericola mali]
MKKILFTIFTIIVHTLALAQHQDDYQFSSKEEICYRKDISMLASDSFKGRKPFTEGELLTTSYLASRFKSIGLIPCNKKSYFQKVPMVELSGSFQSNGMIVKGKEQSLFLQNLTDIVGGTRRVEKEVKINNASIVFAGFGIDAPEYGWNDYKGIDVKGKIVIVMINDPGYYDNSLFRGKDMTYYGRWTYKFEEAARKGALGVLIVHETKPAAYDWSVVRSSWSKSKLYLNSSENNKRCAIEGWISESTAKKLFAMSGINWGTFEQAHTKSSTAISFPLVLNGTLNNKIKKSISTNVIGVLPGTIKKDEYIIYTGHWDHFGVGEAIDGDSIYNGAADNASGTAGLLTLAEKFKSAGMNERTVIFLSVTGEEAGLLGSEYYCTHPIFPLKKTVVDINMDVLQPFGKMKDIFVIGKGMSDVDKYADSAAIYFHRDVKAVPDPSNGWYYRSDHFSFAKVGVPTLYTEGGINSLQYGEVWGMKKNEDYVKYNYHKPSDNYSADWDISGTMDDLSFIYYVGKKLANTNVFPRWNEGIMFKRVREK